MRKQLRAPKRTGPGLPIAMACAAFGEELAIRWAFGGVLVGSWLGRPVSWPADATDVWAVVTILVIATITLVGLDWLNASERAGELRTLLAIGWPAHGVARLVAGEAALLGLAGGAAAAVVDMAGSFVVTRQLPVGLLAAAGATVGTGVLLSLVAAGVSMGIRCTASLPR